MVGNDLAFFVAHHALLLEARDQAIDGFVEVEHVNHRLVTTGGEQRRLVDEIGEVRTGEACGARGHLFQIDFG